MGRAFLWTLALCGCTVYHPVGLYDASIPLPEGYQLGEYVEASHCVDYLLHTFPDNDGCTFRELLDEARGSAPALAEVTLESSLERRLFGHSECWVVTGRQVWLPDGVSAAASTATPTAASRGHSAPAALPDLPELPEEAWRLAERLFDHLQRPEPESVEAWEAEVRTIWAWAQDNDEPSLLEAAAAGQAQVGASATMDQLLSAGFPKTEEP